MHQRFDKLARQIDELGDKMDLYKALVPYQDVANSLDNVYHDFALMTSEPSSEGFRQGFINACNDQRIEPSQALKKLHRVIVSPRNEDLPHIIHVTIINMKLEHRPIMLFFEQIVTDAVKLATLRSACFGMLHPNDAVGLKSTNAQTETWVNEIMAKLAKYEKKFTTISADKEFNAEKSFYDKFTAEVKEVVENGQINATKKDELNNYCDNEFAKGWAFKGERDAGTPASVCRGGDAVNKPKLALYSHLTKKYPWLGWTIVVFNNDQIEWDCPIGNSNHYVKWEKNGVNIFVSWSRPTSQIKENALKANELMKECGGEDATNGWENNLNNCKNNLKTKLPNISKDVIFCHAGGYKNRDYGGRSIYSSGIGTFRSHYSWHSWPHMKPHEYIIDYIVTFYTVD